MQREEREREREKRGERETEEERECEEEEKRESLIKKGSIVPKRKNTLYCLHGLSNYGPSNYKVMNHYYFRTPNLQIKSKMFGIMNLLVWKNVFPDYLYLQIN